MRFLRSWGMGYHLWASRVSENLGESWQRMASWQSVEGQIDPRFTCSLTRVSHRSISNFPHVRQARRACSAMPNDTYTTLIIVVQALVMVLVKGRF